MLFETLLFNALKSGEEYDVEYHPQSIQSQNKHKEKERVLEDDREKLRFQPFSRFLQRQ